MFQIYKVTSFNRAGGYSDAAGNCCEVANMKHTYNNYMDGHRGDCAFESWYVVVFSSAETNFLREEANGSKTREFRSKRESLGNISSVFR